jgi:hypothetical protein
MGAHRGFLQRPYYRDRFGHTYVQRTYWLQGHPSAHAYLDHFYRGVHYYYYTPRHYYHPGFYGWVYNPWAAPVYYNWGLGAVAPWSYGGYFVPAPYYPAASWWLADYLLAENLKLADENEQAVQSNPEPQQPGEEAPPQANGAGGIPMRPQVKALVEAEVYRQLQAEQAAAQSPQTQTVNDQVPPPALDPAERAFVVSMNLGVSTAEGQECEFTPGDVITRIEDTPGSDGKVEVSVMSSKSNDCEVGSSSRVAVTDLQEMHNSFRQQLDAGLDALVEISGTGGLPKAPDTQTSAGEVPPPAPDKTVESQLNEQQKEATQLEAEVREEVEAGHFQPGQPRPHMIICRPPRLPGPSLNGSPCACGSDPRCRCPGKQTPAHTTTDGGAEVTPDKAGADGSHKAQNARSPTGEASSPAP